MSILLAIDYMLQILCNSCLLIRLSDATAANGSIDLSIAHGDKTANGSVTTSVHDLSKQLAAAALIAHGNLDGCECGQQCQDEIKEKCTPKVVTETVCQNVTKESEVTECKTKCYTADKVVEIGVPTIGLNHGSEYQLLTLLWGMMRFTLALTAAQLPQPQTRHSARVPATKLSTPFSQHRFKITPFELCKSCC